MPEMLIKLAVTSLVLTIILGMVTRVSADEDTWLRTSTRTIILFWVSLSGLITTVVLLLAGMWSL